MTKFHFNPETGEAGPCKAEVSCPFGIPLDGHFNSLREAAVGAEKYLSESAGGSFGNDGMVESFEVWKARKDALETQKTKEEIRQEVLPEPTAPVAQYRALMPPEYSYLGDYARSMGLDLQEAWYFAGELYGKPAPTPSEYKQYMLEGVKKHVMEAFEKNHTLDKTLDSSTYFSSPRLRYRGGKAVLETVTTQDGEDLITRVDSKGKVSFEVYNHDEGESQYSQSPDGWMTSIGTWMQDFKSYQDHLYLRVLWGDEQKRRNDRYEAIGARVNAS